MILQALYFSRFVPDTDKGGGCRRMAQIIEVLEKLNVQVKYISTFHEDKDPVWSDMGMKPLKTKLSNLLYPTSKTLRYFRKRAIFGSEINSWSEKDLKRVYRLRYISKLWADTISDLNNFHFVLVDDPIYFLPLMDYLKSQKPPVISVCHNFETLVPLAVKPEKQSMLLAREINAFSQCALNITISREETVLLTNLSINNIYLPYYPVKEIENRMLSVRKKRKGLQKEGYVMIGSAVNSVTKAGMLSIMNHWNGMAANKDKLFVAGYGSDKIFKNQEFGQNIEFLGPLGNEELDAILERVKGCVCYQENGAGALTRISEMLVAGVPVIANSHAARSYYGTHGVIEFNGLDELDEGLGLSENLEVELFIAPDITPISKLINKLVQTN